MVKNPSINVGDTEDAGSIPGSGRSPGEREGNPLQYSGLGNPMEAIQLAHTHKLREAFQRRVPSLSPLEPGCRLRHADQQH